MDETSTTPPACRAPTLSEAPTLPEPAADLPKPGVCRNAGRLGPGGCRLFAWTLALVATLVARGAVLTSNPSTAGEGPKVIWTFDARPLRALDCGVPEYARQVWDTLHVLTAVQGIVNRNAPQLYLFYCSDFGLDTDQFWFDWYRGEDGWLKGIETRALPDLRSVVETFRPLVRGLVVYDPRVPATSNLASTAAGCEDLIPIRQDLTSGSVYHLLVEELNLPVRRRFVELDGASRFTGEGRIPELDQASSGSAKADAYRWAVKEYLSSHRCQPGLAAYALDAFWLQCPTQARNDLHTLPNHDYFIANRAFFFDLSAWADEPATDEPGQPVGTDRRTLDHILRALYSRADGGLVKIGGFTPWPFKYTDHPGVGGRHGGVPTEWEFSRIVSQYNAYVEADAASHSTLANASFHQHYPLADRYPQPNAARTASDWAAAGWLTGGGTLADRLFVGHYVGDYDAPSWLYKAVPAFFRGRERGNTPLAWAFNPNLADRAPQAMVYARRHATTNDWFVAGDSGAGYLNPRALSVRPDSGLAPGLELWVTHCEEAYRKWDLTITGFVLDGSAGASTDLEFTAYARFSPHGLGTHFEAGPAMRAGVPTCPERDLPDDPGAAAQMLAAADAARGGQPAFFWARSILKSPGWYEQVRQSLDAARPGHQVAWVDPGSFFGLIRHHSAVR